MVTYVVMEQPDAADAAPSNVVFVRDGFHWFAFLLPLVWLLWHRLWIEAGLALAVTLLFSAVGEVLGSAFYGSALGLLVSLYFGLEGAALRIRALTRRGWQERAAVQASNLSDAELIYFASSDDIDETDTSPVEVAPSRSAALSLRPLASGHGIGLVPYPGKV